ncbi:histone-binding protein RBBP4 [Nematocida sp. AWRm80]|nr:histone-binding protein RBBP4 [Nematocida sp. AWRm80]
MDSIQEQVCETTTEDIRVSEEFKVWRKNVPYLYDMLVSHVLTWPSLTVQWFPDALRHEVNETTTQRLLLSTHTSNQEEEFLEIATVTLPDVITDSSLKVFEDGGYGIGESKIKITQKIPMESEVNRARCMPSNSNIIVVRYDTPEVCIYDYTKHSSFPKEATPNITLEGHTQGGFGVVWNPIREGELLTGGYDGLVCTYRIGESTKPIGVIKVEGEINDTSLSCKGEHVALAMDKYGTIILDRRDGSKKVLDSGETLCAQFTADEDQPYLVATGSKDGNIRIWDIRNDKEPQHVLEAHEEDVVQIQWSPHFESVLASSGTDRRVKIWNLDMIGDEITEEEREDGPPELMFVHGGHTDTVCDISWNPHEPWEIASVADDNILQIWQMTSKLSEDE